MVWFLFHLINIAIADSAFPPCDTAYIKVEDALLKKPIAVEIVRKEIYKSYNEKRTEILRFVRSEKDIFRKNRDTALKDFDTETKNMNIRDNRIRAERRKKRKEIADGNIQSKKDLAKSLDEKQKTCFAILLSKRKDYLDMLKERDVEQKMATKKSPESQVPDEFKEIPKGPGIVLKPE
ncbi:MAG: hypothetical protein H6623_04570 [Bdellovibrionaceae bacterium]|nr:hypothetical protein [Pseudobdellovibrionaceae bacterium]